MGIQLLQKFMFKKCPDGTETIDIREEIEHHKQEFKVDKPVIIVDVASIHQHIYTSEREKLFGGRYDLYNTRTEETLKKLTQLGVNIICVLDGSLYNDKLKTVLEKRTQRYKREWKILQKLKCDSDILNSMQKLDIPDLKPFFYNFQLIAEKYCTIITSTREGDQEIAYQAKKNKALAIISHDSDFLIFDGDWQLWSGRDMDLNKYSIVRFNRISLRRHLSLSSSQMILFGTLCGNDFVQKKMVEEKFGQYGFDKFNQIAKVIRKLSSFPPDMKEVDKEYLIKLFFTPENITVGVQNFEQSIRFYYDINEPMVYDSPLLNKASNSSFLYSVLTNVPLNIYLCYCDLNENDFKPFYHLIKPVLQRQIGTMLKACREDANFTRPVITKLKHEDPYQIIQEECILPSDNLPTLEEFILIPTSKSDNLYVLKLKLFCWQILPKCTYFTTEIISNIKDEMVLTVATITYLYENKEISKNEADCILFACAHNFEAKQSVSICDFNNINARDSKIAFLFTRLYTVLVNSVQNLGLKNFESLINLDSMYYQYLRNNYDKKKKMISSLEEQYNDYRIYINNAL